MKFVDRCAAESILAIQQKMAEEKRPPSIQEQITELLFIENYHDVTLYC